MTDHRCVICARRDPDDGLTVCGTCLGRIDDDLARLAELVAEAATWTMRQGVGNGSRSVPGSRPPLAVDLLDAALGLDVLPLLESWERLVRDVLGYGPYGPASEARNMSVVPARINRHLRLEEPAEVSGLHGQAEQRMDCEAGSSMTPTALETCTKFLRSNLARVAEAPGFPIEELAREIRDARWAIERLNPEHDRPDGIRVACTGEHPDADGRACGYRLVIDGTMLTQDVECRRCGTVTTGGRMILSALNDPAVTVWAYPDVIEATLGIPTRTLRQWARNGQVARNGSRYDVGAAYRRRAG